MFTKKLITKILLSIIFIIWFSFISYGCITTIRLPGEIKELPIAYNYPPEMRVIRDLLCLRSSLKKMRTERLQHHSCVEDQYIDFLTTQINGLEKNGVN